MHLGNFLIIEICSFGMTAAEQIYHTASLKNTTAPSAASMDTNTFSSASARLNVADVSSQFNLEYYNTMSRQPDHLHGFYGKQSQMVHSVEGDLEAPICTTLEVTILFYDNVWLTPHFRLFMPVFWLWDIKEPVLLSRALMLRPR